MNDVHPRINDAYRQMKQHLEAGILPFWMENGLDREHEGYLTCFDAEGRATNNTDKYLVTQTRMIWGMSAAFSMYPQKHEFQKAARQGVEFMLNHFWDEEHGGWFWKVRRDGGLIDGAKLVYGQSFAIYTLSQYTLSTGDARGLDYAQHTFDLLQLYCADTYRGGYYENLEADWSVCAPGFPGGVRKSLDIHMHLMEAFTTLLEGTGNDMTDEILGHPRGDYPKVQRGIEPTRSSDLPDSGRDVVTLSQDRRTLSLDLSAGSAVDQIRVVVQVK